MSDQDDAWDWGGPRKGRPPLTPSGEPLKSPYQMKQVVVNLAGHMKTASIRLQIYAEEWIGSGRATVEDMQRFISLTESLPILADRLVDFVHGVKTLEEPKEKTKEKTNENSEL